MAGLLYKDFVSVKGKKLCLGYLIYLFVISVLRIVFAGYHEVDEFIVTTERGQTVNLLDAFFLCASAILLIMGACYINLFVQKIVEDDQKNKVMNYMKSMIICKAFAKAGVMQDFQDAINTMVLPLIMLALFSAAVELPLFLRLGYEKAMLVKIALWLVLALVAIGYMMFGNLTIFDRIDLQVIADFIKAHKDAVIIVQVVASVLPLALYYLSYRISCYIMAKEVD